MAGIVTNNGERHILHAACSLGGNLTIHLVKAAFTASENILAGDLVEADFDGYVAEVLTYTGLAVANPGGRAVAKFDPVTFSPLTGATPNQIYGYYVTNTDGDVVIVERFAGSPRPMVATSDNVRIEISLRLWCPA